MDDDRLGRLRLAAQRLTPETAAGDVREAARAVVGVQAQDLRALRLALRSRVPNLESATLDETGLVRTWTVRGTVHLIDEDDLPWLHAITGPRNRKRFDALMAKRGNLDLARSMRTAIVDILATDGPLDRAALLVELATRGHPSLGPHSVNIIAPWMATQGLIRGLPDGRLRAADPPPAVDEDEALTTLARRYLAGYGPATAADLASWSGLPITVARRALTMLGPLDADGDLVALPGTLDAEPPPAPPVLLLAAFDTTMLGYRTRAPLVAPADDHHLLPGAGMLRPVVLVRGRVGGVWRLTGTAPRRTLQIEWFRRPAAARALQAEVRALSRFLGQEIRRAD